ncbi:Ribosomal protein S18 acetylase RimI [Nocardioides exalbidus]|uniref:Ribosomal protein S18 acetylase RimI n=1 Tax=Nocardioides exalbidus TaxID=402596 RepID=A0A1H4Z9L1_9ACTN|nr:GNAT family N-acetyltransferase [Nocardioides exalbidus]SED26882.1 Ribosomal protein S18 acetylase RimI [Nocardioides exalbidus]
MTVTIRRAGEDDAGALSRLAALTFPLACTPQTSEEVLTAHIATRLDPATFRTQLAHPSYAVLVAEPAPGEDPVGYTMLIAGEPDDPDVQDAIRLRPTVALERCYVHPDHHGSGVAILLMEATLEAARATGARGVWLGVSEENSRANAFYGRHGFEVVGTKRFHIGDAWEQDNVRERAL